MTINYFLKKCDRYWDRIFRSLMEMKIGVQVYSEKVERLIRIRQRLFYRVRL